MSRRLLSIDSALKRALAFSAFVVGCPAPEHPHPSGAAGSATVSAPPEAPAAAVGARAAGSASAAPTPVPTVSVAFERVIDEAAIHSVAFGEKRIAALGANAAWMEEGSGWKKMPALPVDTSASRIFFGRDDKPRIMGSDSGEYVYLRFRGGVWKRGDEEIAGLASAPRAPLYGVLGHADPEVVCKLGGGCILKRRSGWTLFEPPALARAPQVELCGAEPYAFDGATVWRIGNDGFVSLSTESPFARADGLWAVSGDDVWVVERDTNSVHHYDGKAWSSARAAIGGPRAVWASAKNDVWVVGDGGAARYDGAVWSRVEGLPERLRTVFGRSASDVLVGGDTGLFRMAR